MLAVDISAMGRYWKDEDIGKEANMLNASKKLMLADM